MITVVEARTIMAGKMRMKIKVFRVMEVEVRETMMVNVREIMDVGVMLIMVDGARNHRVIYTRQLQMIFRK